MLFGFSIGSGLAVYNEFSREWRWFDFEPLGLSNNISTIFEDHAGRIWITTGLGALVLEP